MHIYICICLYICAVYKYIYLCSVAVSKASALNSLGGTSPFSLYIYAVYQYARPRCLIDLGGSSAFYIYALYQI